MKFVSLIFLLTLIIGGSGVSAQDRMCLADDPEHDRHRLGFYSNQSNPFNDVSDYQHWRARCSLSATNYNHAASAYTLIDVRSAKKFSAGHVKQSINLPLNKIKTKRFLKGKKIVLINEGAVSVNLIHACRQLLEAGFKNVKVLAGGLQAILANDKGVLSARASSNLFKVTPADLLHDNRYENWTLVSLSGALSKSISRNFRDAHLHSVYPSKVEFQSNILANKSPLSIVLVDEMGGDYPSFMHWRDQVVEPNQVRNIVYLTGGVRALETFLKRQRIMLNKTEIVLNKPKGCAR